LRKAFCVRAVVDLPDRLDDAGIHGHGDRERLERGPEFEHAKRRAVEMLFRRGLAGSVGIEAGQRGHRQHFAGMHVHHYAGGADRGKLAHGIAEFMLQRLLDLARNGERQRLTARRRVGQIFVEGQLDALSAMSVDVREAEHMRG
jgi:hypothetical protein